MKTRIIRYLLAGVCAFLAACAIITVNVYFPEKAVKEAYKSLDDMLLKNGADKAPATEKSPATEPAQTDKKPQSSLFGDVPALSFCSVAHAAENDADRLQNELKGMPEVIKAYGEMNGRMSRLSTLFDGAAVGLSSQGLVVARDKTKLGPQDEALISQENQNRKTVVYGMAKAILKINGVAESKKTLDQIMGKAAATYAETKRDAAKSGWWIQLQNGRWVQK